MRQDQFEALQSRAEQLIDLFINESNPDKWPGVGLDPNAMDKKTRGDRYWVKKECVATLACAQRIITLVEVVRAKTAGDEDNPGAVTEPTEDLDREVAAAEKEAKVLMDEALRRAKKENFDKHVHGRT